MTLHLGAFGMQCDAMHGKRSGGGGVGAVAAHHLRHEELTMTILNAGQPSPIGATCQNGGVNFSLFARSADRVELLLFDREDDARPSKVVQLDPATNRTYHY